MQLFACIVLIAILFTLSQLYNWMCRALADEKDGYLRYLGWFISTVIYIVLSGWAGYWLIIWLYPLIK